MIFLILGTQKFQLNRLLKEVDSLCEAGVICESVYAQKGHSDYLPQFYEFTDFLDKQSFNREIERSSLVITHSGVGGIISALEFRKPIIVYPRLSKYKEHIDDHQLEIAETFRKKNYVLCCNEKDDLGALIKEARNHFFAQYKSSTDNIINIVKEFLEQNVK